MQQGGSSEEEEEEEEEDDDEEEEEEDEEKTEEATNDAKGAAGKAVDADDGAAAAAGVAAQNGDAPKVAYYLERGASLQATDTLGRTALDLAVASGHEECALLLGGAEASFFLGCTTIGLVRYEECVLLGTL